MQFSRFVLFVSLWFYQSKFTSPVLRIPFNIWLGREDSNLRMQGPKPCALPLGDAPLPITHYPYIRDDKIR